MLGYLTATENGYRIKVYEPFDPTRSRISWGNRKTGFPSINFLAGNKIHPYDGAKFDVIIDWFYDTLNWSVCGTCPCDCPGCYAKKMTRYPNVFYMYAMNTYEIMQDPIRFWELVKAEIKRHTKKLARRKNTIRIDDSGDIVSLLSMTGIIDMAKTFRNITFYGYTEMHDYADILNEEPNINFHKSRFDSYSETDGEKGNCYVDTGKDPRIKAMRHCPAIDEYGRKTGKPCIGCGICPYTELSLAITFHK